MTKYKGQILIVDDALENLQVLSQTLAELGYKVRGAVKGEMALRAARSGEIDLILLDIKMPNLSGYEICQFLKSDPKTAAIPVIFLSALDEVVDKVKGFQVGGVDYITKPFQVDEVLARIDNQITIRRLQKELLEQNQKLQKEIEERRKAEEKAAAASQAKSQFLANMSHELRTPLNAILGFTQILGRDDNLNLDQQQYLKIIKRSSENLLELINDILDLSKIEAGLTNLKLKSFDFYRLLDHLEEMFEYKANQKDIELIFNVSLQVPQYIRTDEQKLRSCLINLLSNATKFTFQGQIMLTVDCHKQEELNPESGLPNQGSEIPSYLFFTVSDTGVGIAPNELDSVFDAFVQTSSGLNSSEGTGLGLTITRKFIEMMGGTITVASTPGQGTTFTFKIILNPAESDGEISTDHQRIVRLQPGSKVPKILVIDDTEENRLLLTKLLEPLGFEVNQASNGLEGIEKWKKWQPDLIFMDTRMPILGGLEAMAEIRQEEQAKGQAKTIIIALTASVFEENRGEVLAAGADDFVRKPFKENAILETIRIYLGVAYEYEELPQILPDSYLRRQALTYKPASFWLEKLGEMPQAWNEKLYQAANQVEEDRIIKLLEEIPASQQILADSLKDLLYDFRLDIIVEVTEKMLKKDAIL